jgi:hypothetical protein
MTNKNNGKEIVIRRLSDFVRESAGSLPPGYYTDLFLSPFAYKVLLFTPIFYVGIFYQSDVDGMLVTNAI